MEQYLESLNEAQLKPVLQTEGPVLVLAGAGSGKTRVLTSRIAHILGEGLAKPSQILAITFTNKAAGEMKERLAAYMDVDRNSWICTIHSMCVRILRSYGSAIGIKDNFSIYTETERSNIIKKIIGELNYDSEKLLKGAKFHIGNAKMMGLYPDEYGKKNADEQNMDQFMVIYEKYDERLRENNALDFDDLLLQTLRLLRKDENTLNYLADKFKYILVDEFQDTNAVQYSIIRMLAYKHCNLFAVGDDDQSIYGWRGAEIENILKFDRDYPSAKVFKLEQNYRSTGNILKLANTIIKNNGTRHKKTLWTASDEGEKPVYYIADEESGEALYTARTITQLVNMGFAKYSDFAILMRINAITRSFEQEFTKYGIPYKVYGGFKFYERKEIKDMLAYLRLISNPFDSEALERIINVPKRGIGGKSIEAMGSYAHENGLTLFDACIDVNELPLNSGAKSKIQAFYQCVQSLIVAGQVEPVNQLVRKVIEDCQLRSAYNDGTEEGDAKLANLDEFIASVDDFCKLNPNATLDEYLNQVTLSSDTDEINDGNFVTLATIHAVKGLEYPIVFVAGLEEGIMPSSRSTYDKKAMEEERRLMYVAITRAEKKLYLTRSRSRFLYGKRSPSPASCFLTELSSVMDIRDSHSEGGKNSYRSYGTASSGYGRYEGDYYNRRGGESGYYSDEPSTSTSFRSQFRHGAPITRTSMQTARPVAQPTRAPMQTTKTNPLAGTQKPAKTYEVGKKVRHPKFGIGTVVALKNGGNVVHVAFENLGIKELSASIAPLEIL